MEFVDQGSHCAFASCNRQDFLPFCCEEGCKKFFCLEHHSMSLHHCPFYKSKIGISPICPLCGLVVATNSNQNIDEVMDNHIQRGCNPPIGSIDFIKHSKPRCSRKGCHDKDIAPTMCKKCHRLFCSKHRHQADHNCTTDQTASQKAAGAALKRRSNEEKKAAIDRLRVKQGASGDDNIPIDHRFALEVIVDWSVQKKSKKSPLRLWIDNRKTVGYVLDIICTKLDVLHTDAIRLFAVRANGELPNDIPLELLQPQLASGDQVKLIKT